MLLSYGLHGLLIVVLKTRELSFSHRLRQLWVRVFLSVCSDVNFKAILEETIFKMVDFFRSIIRVYIYSSEVKLVLS